MSTRCYIAKKIGEDKYKSIYCHNDGGEYVFDTLKKHYSDEKKLDKLFELGDISILEKEVDIPEGASHSFDSHFKDITVAYGRDRGEDETEAAIRTRSDLYDKMMDYHHIFENGEWKTYSNF